MDDHAPKIIDEIQGEELLERWLSLPGKYGAAVRLKQHGLSHQAIAEHLEVSERTVGRYISRGREEGLVGPQARCKRGPRGAKRQPAQRVDLLEQETRDGEMVTPAPVSENLRPRRELWRLKLGQRWMPSMCYTRRDADSLIRILNADEDETWALFLGQPVVWWTLGGLERLMEFQLPPEEHSKVRLEEELADAQRKINALKAESGGYPRE